MMFRYRAVLFEGEMHICGAYSNRGRGAVTTRLGREVMREATMVMGDRTVMRNLSFFNVVSSANNGVGLEGTMANCATTGISVRPNELRNVRIEVREGRYRVGR